MAAGASDCAGCVGVALEVARVAIASPELQLPVPLMLLLNGGEETVLTAAHGFMQYSSWAKQVTHRCSSLVLIQVIQCYTHADPNSDVGLAGSLCLSESCELQVGVFINLESTGPGGPDVVFQHTGTLRECLELAEPARMPP